MDRRLAAARARAKPRGSGATKPGSLLKKQIPIRTFTPWDEEHPGFLEIDLVGHCGGSTAGEYSNTLDMVDVATGWTVSTGDRSPEATGRRSGGQQVLPVWGICGPKEG